MKLKETPNAGENMKQQELSFLASENTKWDSRFRRQLAVLWNLIILFPYNPTIVGHSIYPKELNLRFFKKNLYMNI